MALLHKKEEESNRNRETEPVQMENEQESDSKAGKRKKDKKKRRKDSGQGRQGGRDKHWWEVCGGLNKEQQQAAAEFFSHVLLDLKPERMDVRGEKLYYVPEETREVRGIHFLRNGIYMGDFKKKRFEPSQPFALILSKDTFDRCLDFPGEDQRLVRYLRGESLSVDWTEERDDDRAAAGDESRMQAAIGQTGSMQSKRKKKQPDRNGWYLVLADGFPVGFGKVAGDVLKNKYPAGWRK